MLDFFDITTVAPDRSLLYTGSYDSVLVSLSVVAAIFASYASLLVSQYVSTTTSVAARGRWIAIGGLCLGAGIWTMHFVGMLAFNLPCSSGYDTTLTLLSMIPGILASTLALRIISRRQVSRMQLASGGLLIGAGIGAMHYSGMAAMRLDGLIRYDLELFLLSVVVAVALATLALWIKFRLQSWQDRWQAWAPVASAVVMGMAVSGMHYTAMAAAYFVRGGDASGIDSQLGPSFLASIVLVATGVIIVVTIIATHVAKPRLFSLGQAYKPIGVLIAGWAAIAWLSADYHYSRLANDLYQQESKLAAEQAESVAGNIDRRLQLLKGLPHLLSRTEEVRRAALRFGPDAAPSPLDYAVRRQGWTEDSALGELNRSLAVAATDLRADVIWLVNAAGDCVAASNADQPDSFVGTNYADREYFRAARAGQGGQQFAVGRASKVPGLFYSHPLIEQGRFLGAVVVKRNISNFAYLTGPSSAFIADANGVIILASEKQFEFRALPGAAVAELPVEKRLLQYRQSDFEPLAITPWGDERFPAAVRIDAGTQPMMLAAKALPEDAITVHVSRPLGALLRLGTERVWLFLLLAAAGSMLIVTASAVVLYLRASRKAEADLRVAATAFESQEGMVITDADNIILRINRAFTEMTGYTADEAVGQSISLLKSDRHDATFYAAMWESIERTGSWQGEIWDRRKTGEVYPKWLTITAVRGDDGIITHYVGAHTDITQRKAAEDEIKHLAFYDPLTRLPNRRLLRDRLQHALTAGARNRSYGALLFIDLDNFKTLNDTLGHDKGDLLLQQVAERLTKCVRAEDTVARLGGDEFVMMLERVSDNPHDTATAAEAVGEKILAALNEPYRLAGHDHHSSPSIGVTLFSGHGEELEDVLKRADLAMYQAKAGGRNTLRFFDPDMQAAVNARVALESDLRDAIHTGQLLVYYQVQVDSGGRPTGAEALVRWPHPVRGLVSPADFIPLAEETGLIVPLGLWVLETACAQLVAWAAGPNTAHLSVAVNVSARQFRHPDFVRQVLGVIDRSGADASKLKLELTESILLNDMDDIIAKMTALKARGVCFSLDDFGTGYSSLSYLKRLPLDQLKIDQSFVRDLLTDPNDAAIAKTIVDLARSMGLAVIAEGVETEAQRESLARNGCRAYQGYLFGRPLPLAGFEELLTQDIHIDARSLSNAGADRARPLLKAVI
jgi:diguanylate cyclase (GGDEF)-like protein/PAS domain S-box-containing protein